MVYRLPNIYPLPVDTDLFGGQFYPDFKRPESGLENHQEGDLNCSSVYPFLTYLINNINNHL